MPRNREKQRRARILARKEEYLNYRNILGSEDPTPREAVLNIIEKRK